MRGTPLLLTTAALFASLAAASARAQPELVLSAGYAIPKGYVDKYTDLSARAGAQLPLRVDALYRLNTWFAIGGFAQYGYTFVSDSFSISTASTTGAGHRLGIEGTVHFPFRSRWVPWLGLGFGYEWLRLKSVSNYQTLDFAAAGSTSLEAHIGADYFALPDLAVGPYVGLSLGRYSALKDTLMGYPEEQDIRERQYHGWVELGVRGTFSLMSASPVFLATTATPSARPPRAGERSGFELGLRLSYALALGELFADTDLRDLVTGQIPSRVDALYRLNDQYAVGVFGQFGYAFVADAPCEGASCSAAGYKAGIQVTRHFSSERWFIPWVGVGFGYEVLQAKRKEIGNAAQSVLAHGFELVAVHVGAERFVSPGLAVGPFVGLSFGRYGWFWRDDYDTEEIERKSLHEWLELGVRGAFRL